MDDPRVPIFDWEIMKGDTESLSGAYTDDEGEVEPLTGCDIQCQIRTRPGGKLILTFTTDDGIAINEAAGTFSITIDSSDSLDIDLPYLWYSVLLKNPDGDLRTLFHGPFKVVENTTIWTEPAA